MNALISTTEAARALGTSEDAVHSHAARGTLTRYGTRGRRRWSLDEVRELRRRWRSALDHGVDEGKQRMTE